MVLHDRPHCDSQVDRIARTGAALAADPQVDHGADATVLADLDGAQVPECAQRHVADAALQQARENESAVAGRTATWVVGSVAEHHGSAVDRQRSVDGFVDRDDRCPSLLAKVPELAAQLRGQAFSQGHVVVSDDPQLCAGLGHVAPRKAVA